MRSGVSFPHAGSPEYRAMSTRAKVCISIVVVALLSLPLAYLAMRRQQRPTMPNGGVIWMRGKLQPGGELRGGLSLYRVHMGTYPATLHHLLVKPSDVSLDLWGGPYVNSAQVLTDTWGRRFEYLFPCSHDAEGYELRSLGPDGLAGTEDDIVVHDHPDELK